MKRLALASALVLLALPLLAVEGKWTPQQIPQLDPAWLKQLGLELPPERLWDPQRGTGLLAATIDIGGCSAGWISAEGLFVTNHHCLFDVLQEHATPQNDVITNGFLARTRDAELKGTVRATVPRRFTDVTAAVLAAVPQQATDAQRFRAIEKKSNEIEVECEKQPGARCTVAAHDGGLQYVLQEMTEIADVRLVYAPPRAIGEYGGEVDNWMWPRHTGDFAIGRAYVDGKPYRPEFFFPISTKGVQPGDFVMVLGYPGITYRSLTAGEMEERHAFFTARADVYREWIDLLERSTRGNPSGEIAVADNLKSLLNTQKNATGQLEGFRRGGILARQRTADDAVAAFVRGRQKDSPGAAPLSAYQELERLAKEKKESLLHDFLLDHVRMSSPTSIRPGARALTLGWAVVRNAVERQKPESERDSVFTQRNAARLRERLEREQKSVFLPADRALLASFVRRALALPATQRIAAIDDLYRGATTPEAIDARTAELLDRTKVLDAGERAKMLEESVEQLRARRDPVLEAAFALDADVRALEERLDRWRGAISRLRPAWRRAVIEHAGRPVPPDANSTLRVSFAHVKGYEPRDAVFYQPQTTLAGVVEKHTGSEPFDVPDGILAAAAAERLGRWKDAQLGDVPVAFLADADTTGGNSGSPTVNARGELVGVNFDRVWENVANDFGYLPDVGRNVNADVRYMLWILEEVESARELLNELGVTAPPAR